MNGFFANLIKLSARADPESFTCVSAEIQTTTAASSGVGATKKLKWSRGRRLRSEVKEVAEAFRRSQQRGNRVSLRPLPPTFFHVVPPKRKKIKSEFPFETATHFFLSRLLFHWWWKHFNFVVEELDISLATLVVSIGMQIRAILQRCGERRRNHEWIKFARRIWSLILRKAEMGVRQQ